MGTIRPLRVGGLNTIAIAVIGLVLLLFQSCATVKPYQRAYLNDYEMQQGKKDIEKFEDNVHVYREGASGAGSKGGGGCGCN